MYTPTIYNILLKIYNILYKLVYDYTTFLYLTASYNKIDMEIDAL